MMFNLDISDLSLLSQYTRCMWEDEDTIKRIYIVTLVWQRSKELDFIKGRNWRADSIRRRCMDD